MLHYELLCYLKFVNCNPNIPSVCVQCRVNQFYVESNPGWRQEAQFPRSPPCCRTATPYLHCKSFYPASHPLCLAETKTLAFQKRYLCLFASLFSNCTKKPLLTGFVSKKPIWSFISSPSGALLRQEKPQSCSRKVPLWGGPLFQTIFLEENEPDQNKT